MKIDFARVLRVAGRLIVAAPAIIELLEPVLAKRKRRARTADGGGSDASSLPPAKERVVRPVPNLKDVG